MDSKQKDKFLTSTRRLQAKLPKLEEAPTSPKTKPKGMLATGLTFRRHSLLPDIRTNQNQIHPPLDPKPKPEDKNKPFSRRYSTMTIPSNVNLPEASPQHERLKWSQALMILIKQKKSPEEIDAYIKDAKANFLKTYLINQAFPVDDGRHYTPFLYAVLQKEFSTAFSLIKHGADPFKTNSILPRLQELVGNENQWFYAYIEALRAWKSLLTPGEKREAKIKKISSGNLLVLYTDSSNRLEDIPPSPIDGAQMAAKIKERLKVEQNIP